MSRPERPAGQYRRRRLSHPSRGAAGFAVSDLAPATRSIVPPRSASGRASSPDVLAAVSAYRDAADCAGTTRWISRATVSPCTMMENSTTTYVMLSMNGR